LPKIAMLTLINGQDSYRSREKTRELAAKHSGKISFLDEKDGIEGIKKETLQESIFKEKKMIVLNNLWSLIQESPEKGFLLEKIKNSEEITFVFREEKIDKKGESFFGKNGKVFVFEPLKGRETERWIGGKIKAKGGTIEEEALSLLAESVGNDLWMAANEISKLLAYKKNIKKGDVILLTSPKIEGDIFRAVDFLASKNRKAALDVFYKHIKRGDNILYLIAMVAFQFRNLILVKMNPNSSNRELKMHPFVFQKSTRLAAFFSERELKAVYREILAAEVSIKTGKADPEAAFDFLIAKIK